MKNIKTVIIKNSRGLHARAAAKFVKTASRFNAKILVTKNDQTVTGLSIMGLMMLSAGPGSEIKITSTGLESKDALSALINLIDDGFEEN